MKARDHFKTPSKFWDRVTVRFAGWEQVEGVSIATAGWREPTPEGRAKLSESLRLISRYAPRQFERVARLMRGIIITGLYWADASWRPNLQVCMLDLDYLQSDRASIASLASTIIHELTHARLHDLGFTYEKERRARIEHICHRAELRFLSGLPQSSQRDQAIQDVEERLCFEPWAWSDEAIRILQERQPWYVRGLQFVFRPLPDVDG